jgi:ribosomal protein S18 acetylase RimI-like enzyme
VPVTVRRAVDSDAGGLARLAAITFPLACTPHTSADLIAAHIASTLDPSSFLGHLADPACTILVADVDGAEDPVGYTMLVLGEPDDPDVVGALRLRPTVALERCYVHPDHHGSGVASLLMEQTLLAAAGTGARGAWLGVSEDNARANAFYARHGFEQVGTKRFHIGEVWEQDNVRERPL